MKVTIFSHIKFHANKIDNREKIISVSVVAKMLLGIVSFYALLMVSMCIDRHQINVYFTDQSYKSNLMHHCLYYYAGNHFEGAVDNRVGSPQIIPYCIRSEFNESLSLVSSDMNGKIYTFNELRLKQITSEQLYEWSAPIDLAERYQIYLNILDELLSNETFKNCTSSWFGQFCEFQFDENWSLQDIVKLSFFSKKNQLEYIFQVTNHTCYIHLNCFVGPEPLCLDWRDICNGKIDCINSDDDERDCVQLEINICNENEFQCHNGQCIPIELFRNDEFNPDCLDGSDEWSRLICAKDPTIRCEDHSSLRDYPESTRSVRFSCGDGELVHIGQNFLCSNRRNLLFSRIMFSKSNNPLLTTECWLAMIHYFQLYYYANISINETFPCYEPNKECNRFIFINCPSLFIFPSLPILFGHVYLFYFHNQLNMNISSEDSTPTRLMYICYNNQLCPFMPWTIKINGLTCRAFNDLVERNSWFAMIEKLPKIFWSCSTNGISEAQCKNNEFYQCETSTKCIPNRRLIDGYIDCFDGSDERTNYSCSINDDLRFACTSENKCISYLIENDSIADCLNGEDEYLLEKATIEELISFPTICDGFIEINLDQYINNHSVETDETSCDQWPCINVYTRCDDFWNCKNGSDELNCPHLSNTCAENEFKCVSAETFEFICLASIHANDGYIDCLGGSDERFHCRDQYPEISEIRFHCWNSTECIDVYSMCTNKDPCPYQDHNKFCDSIDMSNGICYEYLINSQFEHHPSRDFLCNLDEVSKEVKSSYFTLTEQKIVESNSSEKNNDLPTYLNYEKGSLNVAWLCNRGLFILRWTGTKQLDYFCFCPPAYYGHRCQYQSQRISLSYRVKTIERRTVFNMLIMLIDNTSQIHSYEQRSYLAFRDCNFQFGINLLYSNQPKDPSKQYTVRIDLFEQSNLNYRASWEFPVQFSALPVYPIANILIIPSESSLTSTTCSPKCVHGECLLYVNTQRPFCRCFHGWFGLSCERNQPSNCTNRSFSMGSPNNHTICVCSLGKYGPKCFLTRSSCQSNTCLNDGLCVPEDERIGKHNFLCICKQGYIGVRCEHEESRIEISFSNMAIPTSMFVHFITVMINKPHLRTTMIKKIAYDQNSAIVYQTLEYHIIFVQFSNSYYLAYLESKFQALPKLDLSLVTSNHCPSVNMLFNSTIMSFSLLQRIKYYHVLCREQINLKCFYDEIHMCLCSNERHANCLKFDHNITYDCYGLDICKNGAQCLQDHPSCPSSIVCVCAECFYGSRCQFSTKGFGLSLDVLLGYQVHSHITLRQQPKAVQVSMAITMIILALGLANGILSIMTFRSKKSRESGCGLYLLCSSITSILTTIIFTFKFWLAVLSQNVTITNRSYLKFSCTTTDMLLQVFINSIEWLNAAVSIERAYIVIKSVTFQKAKTKRIAKIIIPILIGIIILTTIHDPLHRHLIDDPEEQRTWCIISFSDKMQLFNSIMKIFHFLTPFIFNIGSAITIIITISRHRSKTKKQITYKQHLCEQFREHRNLLISPIILIILHLPRLIISFIPGCMKSARNPWIFLIGYFISCVPSLLTFIIFVLFSDTYKQEFADAIRKNRIACKRLLAIE
jgi:hypothetical protein